MQQAVQAVRASDALADYVYRLVESSRAHPDCRLAHPREVLNQRVSSGEDREHAKPDSFVLAEHDLVELADNGRYAGFHRAYYW